MGHSKVTVPTTLKHWQKTLRDSKGRKSSEMQKATSGSLNEDKSGRTSTSELSSIAKQQSYQPGAFPWPRQMTEWAGPDPGGGSPLSTVGMWWTEPGPKSIPLDHIPSNLPDTAFLIHDGESREAAWQHIQDLHQSDEGIVGIFKPQELLWPGRGIVRHHAPQGCLYILFHMLCLPISLLVKTGRQTGGRPQQPAKLPPECWHKLGSPIWHHTDGKTMQVDYMEQNQLLQSPWQRGAWATLPSGPSCWRDQ